MAKKNQYRKFPLKGKMERFKRYSFGGTDDMSVVMDKSAVKSFKQSNNDRYYIRSVHRYSNKYEIYLRKK